jgi:hypothetical protein
MEMTRIWYVVLAEATVIPAFVFKFMGTVHSKLPNFLVCKTPFERHNSSLKTKQSIVFVRHVRKFDSISEAVYLHQFVPLCAELSKRQNVAEDLSRCLTTLLLHFCDTALNTHVQRG